jgi:predicted nucleic acid-binding protein
MSYLVDTDRLIDGLSGRPEALALFERHRDDGLGVSIISLGEVYEGAYGHSRSEAHIAVVREFLSLFTVIPLSDSITHRFARVRGVLRQQGSIIPDFDLLIAATALDHDLVLVSRNRWHFSRIPEVQIYDDIVTGSQ